MTRILLIMAVLSLWLPCCAHEPPGRDRDVLSDQIFTTLYKLSCEDSQFVGFASAYLGHEKWMEVTEAYRKVVEEKHFGCRFEYRDGYFDPTISGLLDCQKSLESMQKGNEIIKKSLKGGTK